MKKGFIKHNKFLLFVVIPAFALITIMKFDWTVLIFTLLFVAYAVRLYMLFDLEEIEAYEWFKNLNVVDKKSIKVKYEKGEINPTEIR